MPEIKSEILKLISGNESLIIDPTGWKKTQEYNVFTYDVFTYIDTEFKYLKISQDGPIPEKTPVSVYEMICDKKAKDITLYTHAQIFCSLSSDLFKLTLTTAQIKGFAKKYRNWLRIDGYGTFFLIESDGHFYVVVVFMDPNGDLREGLFKFGYRLGWDPWKNYRVVVPQLV